jgi:hypothetical protein
MGKYADEHIISDFHEFFTIGVVKGVDYEYEISFWRKRIVFAQFQFL